MFKKMLLIGSFLTMFTTANAKEEIYLFSKASCPYCAKVIRYLQSQNRVILIKDISKDPEALKELISKGGKRQVPCLYHNGTYLYESADIIDWLSEHTDLLPSSK
jgi:glutaredoxin